MLAKRIRLSNFLKQYKEETIKCYKTSFTRRNPDEKGIEKIVALNILLSKFRMRLHHNFPTKRVSLELTVSRKTLSKKVATRRKN